MSIWSRFIKALEHSNGHSSEMTAEKRDPSRYAIVDVEVGTKNHKIHDISQDADHPLGVENKVL